MSTFIIAEAGVNHNGELSLAKDLISVAKEAGADAVKFQTFKAESLSTRLTPKANYQLSTTDNSESHLAMLKRLEMSENMHFELKEFCQQKSISFMSSAFDVSDLIFLNEKLGLALIKIPSGEITNGALLWEAARRNCKLIISTGMSYLSEIESALQIIGHGYLNKHMPRSKIECQDAYSTAEARKKLKEMVSILHCTSEYPASFQEVNLRVMDTLKTAFDLNVGISDHTEGMAVPIAAVAMGATIVEKHFTLDKNMKGPDHRASLNPMELGEMVKSIRQVELALGSSVKGPTSTEQKNKPVIRKSLVAKKDIQPGELFSVENLTSMRPGTGISPMEIWNYFGRASKRAYVSCEMIEDQL